jgi:hypothetical protein
MLAHKTVKPNAAEGTFSIGDWNAQERLFIVSVLMDQSEQRWAVKSARSSTFAAEGTAKAHLYLPMESSIIITALVAFHPCMSHVNSPKYFRSLVRHSLHQRIILVAQKEEGG